MSKIGYCPRGGQDGIVVGQPELVEFSNAINARALDEYIPIPGVDVEEQKSRMGKDGDDCIACNCDPMWYWENGHTGSHGWCCCNCGKVHQWG